MTEKYFEIWVSWKQDEPAYTCDDKSEAQAVFAGAKQVMFNNSVRIDLRTRYGDVIESYPKEEVLS